MLRVPVRPSAPAPLRGLMWFLIGVLGVAGASALGDEAQTREPATADEAAKVLDLAAFPLMDGAEDPGVRRMASLTYQVKADVKRAYDFQKAKLADRGWEERPGGHVSDQVASGTFTRGGFTLSAAVFPTGDPEKPGQVMVTLVNHGNVDTSKLPVPPDAKPLYSGPTSAMYVSGATAEETAKACRGLLMGRGWQPYGSAGETLFFKKNAVRLTAQVAAAPAQGGKTVIQYSTEQLSADLPAPPDSLRAQYADVTKELSFDTPSRPEEVAAFYRDALGKLGWTPTTEGPTRAGSRQTLIFRNARHDLITLEMNPIEDFVRARLGHQSAAELAEIARRAKAATASKPQASPRPEPAAKVAIPLPAGAQGVEQDAHRIKYNLEAGKAKAAVEALRTKLRRAGWKEEQAELEPMFGVLSLAKDGDSLTIAYVDTRVMPAEVTIMAVGAELQVAKAPAR